MSDTGYSADNDELYGSGDTTAEDTTTTEDTTTAEESTSTPTAATPPVGHALSNGHIREEDKPLLPVTRPPAIIVRLITSTSAKIALPLGEALMMSTSTRGKFIITFNSSYLHVIDVLSFPDKKVRAFEVSRRPIAADIHDNGTLLAVLSTKHVVNIYDIKIGPAPRLVKTIHLELPADAITLDRTGHMLAVCGPNSVDVFSLSPHAGDATRRCATAGLEMDHVEFSQNSKWLLATTKNINRGTLVVSVPLYSEDPLHPNAEELREVWTGEMLDPKLSSKLQSACLWQHDGMVEVVGAIDASTNLAVATAPEDTLSTIARCKLEKTSKLRELGIRDFPVITATENGSFIASLTNRICVRVLQIPNNIAATDIRVNIEETYDIPEMDENTTPCLKFCQDKKSQRLLILSPAVPDISKFCTVDESFSDDDGTAEGGRVIVLNFDKAGQPGLEDEHVTIHLDTENARVLPEQQLDLKTEVALERRRTLTQKKHSSLPTISNSPRRSHTSDHRRRSHRHTRVSHEETPPVPSVPNEAGDDDLPFEAMEEPYTPSQPRSRATLLRASSVSQSSPYFRQRLRAQPAVPVEYRRADGSDRRLARDPPHESDADNWEPPPPMYTAEANTPLPLRYWDMAGLRNSLMQGASARGSQITGNDILRPNSATGSYAAPRAMPWANSSSGVGIPPLASELGTWGSRQQMNLIRRRPLPGGVGIGRMDTIRSISTPASTGTAPAPSAANRTSAAPSINRSSTAPSVVPTVADQPPLHPLTTEPVPLPEPTAAPIPASPASTTHSALPPISAPVHIPTPSAHNSYASHISRTSYQAYNPAHASLAPTINTTQSAPVMATRSRAPSRLSIAPSIPVQSQMARPLTPYEETMRNLHPRLRSEGPTRTPSRAKRSARENVREMKKKGLLGGMKRGREKEVTSGAGGGREKGGGKCVVM
ncbi:MAG: hypothetical protein M1820_007571 [Bogoriella megaspora]|nr:MAG: hypothetical protein M1820_007571 [Bogoriella megaspora]